LKLPTLPTDLPEVARRIDAAEARTIDVGRVTLGPGSPHAASRYFLLWSGLGLDAHITRAIEPRPRSFRRWGVVSYSLAALRAALAYRGVEADIDIDGRRLSERAVLIVVSNAELYAGNFHVSPGARLDDGWLDVTIFRGRGFLTSVGHAWRVLLGLHKRDRRALAMRARRLRVTTTPICDVHVDAEPIGASPVEFEVIPRSLRILVPPGAPESIFADRHTSSGG
jgi:diacylglycerol kinase family enzyme